jgi:hypothetical protein
VKRLILASVLGIGLVAGTAVPAFAGDPGGGPGCNSGRGNLSEDFSVNLVNPHIGGTGPGIVGTLDCDPGNSGAVNSGGD